MAISARQARSFHAFFVTMREQKSIVVIFGNFDNRTLKNRKMPRFRITTKHMKQSNGIRIEPGMSVEVVSQSFCNPVTTNGGQSVADAFMRIYGIEIKKAGCMNMCELEVEKLA